MRLHSLALTGLSDVAGTIDREEFRQLHADCVKNGIMNKSYEDALTDLDTDGNGEISFNEYLDFLIRYAYHQTNLYNLQSDVSRLVFFWGFFFFDVVLHALDNF